MSDHDDDDRDDGEVPPTGYKKPPHKHKWKPGQSGNRDGRPKGRKNLSSYMDDELTKTRSVVQNGKAKKIPTIHAMIIRVVHDALAGKDKAIAHVFQHLRDIAPKDVPPVDLSAIVGPRDAPLMDDIIAQILSAQASPESASGITDAAESPATCDEQEPEEQEGEES